MRFFERLGESVREAWCARNFDERVFHEVAVAELEKLRPSDHVSGDDIVEWVHEARELPPQGDLKNSFGSPPLMVYQGHRFYIEALFWVDATTAVHQHRFIGAFHVLEGSSLHSLYSYRAEHHYSDRLSIGTLTLDSVEHLRKGAVRPIRGGREMIHSLFHLDRPSVSIVVRAGDPCGGPQYAYERNGISHDPFHTPDGCAKKIATLDLLKGLDRPYYDRARKTIEAADAFTAYRILSWFAGAAPDADYDRLLDELKSPHDALVARVRLQRDEAARERSLIERRARIRSAEHRFFLALLLNLPSRTRILEVVAKAFPGAPPVETVVRWVAELAELRLDDGRNALDVELPPDARRIFGHLVDGATNDEVLARLRAEFDDVDEMAGDVVELCEAFRQSLMFRTLFMP